MMKTTQMTVISLGDLAEELDWTIDLLRSILIDEDTEERQNFIVYDPSELDPDSLTHIEKCIFDCITENFGNNPVIIKNSSVYKVTFIKKEKLYVDANNRNEAIEKAYAVVDNNRSSFFSRDSVDEYNCWIADSAEYADAKVYH